MNRHAAPHYEGYEHLLVELIDRVAVVTLNAPDRLNAVDRPMHEELEAIWVDLNHDDRVGAVVLTGAGRAFCAGGDLQGMAEGAYHPSRRMPVRYGRRLIHNLLELEAPVVAAVNGDAVGLGATLALFCDIIFVAEGARLGDPHVKVGLVAGDGGAAIWPLLCGLARAKQYLLTGDLLDASEAERIGLVNFVVPAEMLQDQARAFASRLANGPTRAIRWTKLAANKITRMYVEPVLDASLALEGITFVSEDHREAVDAVLAKRPPRFAGR